MEEFDTGSFAIYPNPSQGNIVHLEFENINLNPFSVEIRDISGKQLFFVRKVNDNQIDVLGLDEGFYFLNIQKEGKTVSSQKFIKSNP